MSHYADPRVKAAADELRASVFALAERHDLRVADVATLLVDLGRAWEAALRRSEPVCGTAENDRKIVG